jgi:hypothetical protein
MRQRPPVGRNSKAAREVVDASLEKLANCVSP